GQLSVAGLLTWTANSQSSITGPGQVQANGGLAVTGDGTKTLTGGVTLTNAGSATWMGSGAIVFSQGATLNNASGSTLTIQNAQTLGLGRGGTFNNAGTILKSSVGVTEVPTAFHNTGTIDVQAGTFRLSGTGSGNGAFTVESGGALEFTGSLQVLQAGSQVSGAGNVLFSGGNTYLFGSYNLGGLTSMAGGTAYFLSDATLAQLTLN